MHSNGWVLAPKDLLLPLLERAVAGCCSHCCRCYERSWPLLWVLLVGAAWCCSLARLLHTTAVGQMLGAAAGRGYCAPLLRVAAARGYRKHAVAGTQSHGGTQSHAQHACGVQHAAARLSMQRACGTGANNELGRLALRVVKDAEVRVDQHADQHADVVLELERVEEAERVEECHLRSCRHTHAQGKSQWYALGAGVACVQCALDVVR